MTRDDEVWKFGSSCTQHIATLPRPSVPRHGRVRCSAFVDCSGGHPGSVMRTAFLAFDQVWQVLQSAGPPFDVTCHRCAADLGFGHGRLRCAALLDGSIAKSRKKGRKEEEETNHRVRWRERNGLQRPPSPRDKMNLCVYVDTHLTAIVHTLSVFCHANTVAYFVTSSFLMIQ